MWTAEKWDRVGRERAKKKKKEKGKTGKKEINIMIKAVFEKRT